MFCRRNRKWRKDGSGDIIMQAIKRSLSKRIGRTRHRLDTLLSKTLGQQRSRRVVFLHIPKCAGSSATMLFKSRYGSSRSGKVVLIDDGERGYQYSESLKRAKDAQFVGGHFGFDTLEKIRGDAFVFTILRDPFERLRSISGHIRTRRTGNVAERGLNMSLHELLASRDDCILHYTDNVMARMLAASHDRRSVKDLDENILAEKAIENLKHFDHVGFFEDLDDDLKFVASVAGVRFTQQWENRTVAKAELKPPFDATSRQIARSRLHADLNVFAAAQQMKQI